MGTIDTMLLRDQSLRVGNYTFDAMDTVPFRVWFQVAVAMSVAKMEKRRTRRHLMKLSYAELRDIGICEVDADIEIRKSFPMYQRTDRR